MENVPGPGEMSLKLCALRYTTFVPVFNFGGVPGPGMGRLDTHSIPQIEGDCQAGYVEVALRWGMKKALGVQRLEGMQLLGYLNSPMIKSQVPRPCPMQCRVILWRSNPCGPLIEPFVL